MKLSYKSVLPFAISLLSHLQKAVDELKKKGVSLDEKQFSSFVKKQISSWEPTINGIKILDDKTRSHAVLFIAGVALNLMKGSKNE